MVYFWTLAGSFPRAILADFRIVLDNKSWTEIHCWNASWSSILYIIIINMTVHSAGSCIVTKWYNSHGFWGLLKDIFWRYCISVQLVPLLYKLFCRKILHCSTEEFEVFLVNLCMQRFMAILLRKKCLEGSRWQGWHIKQKIHFISAWLTTNVSPADVCWHSFTSSRASCSTPWVSSRYISSLQSASTGKLL